MNSAPAIPVFALYGEGGRLPDILHCERILDRAAVYDWVIAPHRHADLHQFFAIEDGAFRLTIDGEGHDLHGPTVLSLPRQSVHGFTFAMGTRGYVVTLPLSEFRETFGDRSTLAPHLAQWAAHPASPDEIATFAAIHDAHQGRRPFRTEMLRALALQMACHVAQHANRPPSSPLSRRTARMAAFERLVQAHLRDHWRVKDYAAALSLTPVHLNRVVREATGMAVSDVIDQTLFQEACRLLAYTPATVASVAYAMGFDDPSYFSRAFHRRVGMAPAQYRKRARMSDLIPGS